MYISSCKYCTSELHAQILTHPCPEEYPGFYSTKNTANECKTLCFLWYNNDIMGTVQIFASTTLILYLDQFIKVVEQIVFWISFLFLNAGRQKSLLDEIWWSLDFYSHTECLCMYIYVTGCNVCGLYYWSWWQSVTVVRSSPALFASRSPEQERKGKR